MIAFAGEKCLVCGQEMQENDEIAVCPECGTPYHRACYLEQGKCINTALHKSGESWQKQQEQEIIRRKSEEKRAEQERQALEREQNGSNGMFQESLYDGVRIESPDPCVGLDPTEELDGVTMGELAEFVRTNNFYYLPLFRLMKTTGKRISLNVSGLLFPELYFANRKMWVMAIVSLLLKMLFSIPTWLKMLVMDMGMTFPWLNLDSPLFLNCVRVSSLGSLIFPILCCMFANYWYYRFAVKRIRKLKKTAANEADFHTEMKAFGGSKLSNVAIIFVLEMALLSILMFCIENI